MTVNKMKKSMCTTLPVRDRAIFYLLCYKAHGYQKYSIQKGVMEAIGDYNAKKLETMSKDKRKAFFREVKDFLFADKDVRAYLDRQKAQREQAKTSA